uniref:Uncharacterized protein n=3 Tax=gambiae species complex TaxID=44542 RepID=A0A182V984_ANOME
MVYKLPHCPRFGISFCATSRSEPNLKTPHFKMFKYVIVLLALIAAVFAAPKPQYLLAPASYSYSESYRQPAAATVYSSGAYIPTAYTTSYAAPAVYSASYPAAYVY